MLALNKRHYGICTETSNTLTLRFLEEFLRTAWNHQGFGEKSNKIFRKQFSKISYANTIINTRSETTL